MSVLSDITVRALLDSGTLVIDPLPAPDAIQPASIDLTLGGDFVYYCPDQHIRLDKAKEARTERALWDGIVTGYWLDPGKFVLGTTVERVSLPGHIVGRVEAKSSLGRIGLTTHATAGFIDPGFDGKITLEFFNMNRVPIVLQPGRPICQLSLLTMDQAVERPYGHSELGSKYQHQMETTASRYGDR